jgi:hypothetical protein
MTHHLTAKTLLDKAQSSRRTFENTRCSWCQTEANYWTSMGEENFVPVEGKKLGEDQAFAVFCPECLKDPSRKKEVKYVVSIGEAEDAIPAQTPFRELTDAGDSNNEEINTRFRRVPAEESTGASMVETRATENVKEEPKKKGLFGK